MQRQNYGYPPQPQQQMPGASMPGQYPPQQQMMGQLQQQQQLPRAQSEALQDSFLLGNQVFPFQCPCGKGLAREREIQQHSNCQQFTGQYGQLLQAFVQLKHVACQQNNTIRSYQNKMSLHTLLTSFRADIKEHLTRELEVLGGQPPKPQEMQQMPVQPANYGAAAPGGGAAAYEEEKKEEEIDMSGFEKPSCVYCMRSFSEAEQSANQVQMFLADGCYHQFHTECFRNYAKKQLLTKMPNGDFGECKCRKCNTVVQAEDLREALGPEWLQNIREQQTKMMMQNVEGIVQCPACNEVFGMEPSPPNYAAKDEAGKTVSRETAEHMARYRVRCPANLCNKNFCTNCKKEPYHIGMSCEDAENHRVALKCRFCWEPLTEPSLSNEPAFLDVCRTQACVELMNKCCKKILACGHKCRGFVNERRCLPCLNKDCIKLNNEQQVDFQLYEDYSDEDYCGICMISGLGDEPSIMLGCKHIFHVECIKKRVFGRWPSPRVTWDFLDCSACKVTISIQADHVELYTELKQLLDMKKKVYDMSIERAKYEAIDKDPRLRDPNDNYYNNLQAWALFKLAYYQCFKCKVAYFGGMKDCIAAQQASQEFKPEDLVCGKCSSQALGLGAGSCKTHGTDFIEFKCKFCCSISQWFCWGNTHFCEPCHTKQCAGDYVSRKKVADLPKCPGKQRCTLKIDHPPNGTEFSLGCAICRNAQDNVKNF